MCHHYVSVIWRLLPDLVTDTERPELLIPIVGLVPDIAPVEAMITILLPVGMGSIKFILDVVPKLQVPLTYTVYKVVPLVYTLIAALVPVAKVKFLTVKIPAFPVPVPPIILPPLFTVVDDVLDSVPVPPSTPALIIVVPE